MTSRLMCLIALCGILLLRGDSVAEEPTPKYGSSSPANPTSSKIPAAATKPDDKWDKPRVLVTTSKETTYITEPLRKDGYVDYVAATNARYSKGVTPENNAAVLFWKAVGPEPVKVEKRDEFFKALGMGPPPKNRDNFITFYDFVAAQRTELQRDKANEKELAALDKFSSLDTIQPWLPAELPVHAKWLNLNGRALDLIVDACKRPRSFHPIIASDTDLPYLLSTADMEIFRYVAGARVTRALLNIHLDKIDTAWENLLATHRLARLVGQGPSFGEFLLCLSIDNMADVGDQALLRHTLPSAAEAKHMFDDLNRLSPYADVARIMDETERFHFLSAVAICARGKPHELAKKIGCPDPRTLLPPTLEWSAVDWDDVLAKGNRWYDRMLSRLRAPNREMRHSAWQDMIREFYAREKRFDDKLRLALDAAMSPKDTATERISLAVLHPLFPAGDSMAGAADRYRMRLEITKLGFAMARYHADHGSYPSTLAELAPKYVAKIPKDIFSDNDLRYRLTLKRENYVIYSVGPNGVDDGGKGEDNVTNGEDWDDIALSVPGPAKVQQNP